MTLDDCDKLVAKYLEWLEQKITIKEIEEYCEITTPFIDRHNDQIQIYMKKIGDVFVLTDDGYTINDLKLSGFEISTEKREIIINAILNGFGVHLVNDEMRIEAEIDNFPQKKHNLIQAILAINDMFVMAEPIIAKIFLEDVVKFLRKHQIRFIKSYKFTGKSGYDQTFDFVIPESSRSPERILQTIHTPTKQYISDLLFIFDDTKEARPAKSITYSILNDTEKDIKIEHITALKEYGIRPLLWSERDNYVEELAQ